MLEGHTNYVFDVAISADGGKIVSGSRDSDDTVRVWTMETGEVPCDCLLCDCLIVGLVDLVGVGVCAWRVVC